MSDERTIDLLIQNGLLTMGQLKQAQRRFEFLQVHGHEPQQQSRSATRTLLHLLVELEYVEPEDCERFAQLAQQSSQAKTKDPEEGLVHGYHLAGRIGRGGMGDVFLGHKSNDDGTQEEVAVKLLPHRLARDHEYLARFRRESDALAGLNHPHITKFIAEGLHDGRPYLIMEVVRGRSLKERLTAGGALNEYEARCLLHQMTHALHAAWHQSQIVHRDVKPANILLADSADADVPFMAKLCDFGLAKFNKRTQASEDMLTNTGVAVGTPHYMSPEQATGDRTADPRHDIYGLAATIYHALLGKTLYSGGSSAVIMYKQATASLDIQPLQRRGISAELVDLLSAMLAKPRDRRLPHWQAVVDRLELLPPIVQPDADRRGPPLFHHTSSMLARRRQVLHQNLNRALFLMHSCHRRSIRL